MVTEIMVMVILAVVRLVVAGIKSKTCFHTSGALYDTL
jgi:hypothetical protein